MSDEVTARRTARRHQEVEQEVDECLEELVRQGQLERHPTEPGRYRKIKWAGPGGRLGEPRGDRGGGTLTWSHPPRRGR